MPLVTRQLARVLLVTALVLAGCRGESAEDLIVSARAFLDKRDYGAAIIQLKNAAQKAPDNAEARFLLGTALRSAGDPVAAEIEFRKALQMGHDPNAVVPALYATLLDAGAVRKLKDEKSAEKLSSDPARAEVEAVLGDLGLRETRVADARLAYEAALRKDPGNVRAQIGQARITAVEGDLAATRRMIDAILASHPESVDALRIQGELLVSEGRTRDAIAVWDKAIALQPTGAITYASIVPALLREKDPEGAMQRVAALRKAAPGLPLTAYLETLVHYSRGDLKAARESIRQALKGAPDYMAAALLAGNVEHDLGNYLLAEEQLLRVVSDAPENVYARRLLVSTYLRSGRLEKARESVKVLDKLAPDDPATAALVGEVALAAGDSATASRAFSRAIAKNPGNVGLQTRLAQASLLKGDVDRAVEQLQAASSADPTRAEADAALINHFLGRKQYDKALAAADALVRKQPTSAAAMATRGLVLLSMKDRAAAREAFAAALKLDSSFIPAVRSLAMLDIQDKRVDDAKQRFREVLTRDPKQVEAALQLATILQQTASPRAEIDKVLADVIEADPISVAARVALIGHLLQTDRKKEALDAALKAQTVIPDSPRILEMLARAQVANADYSQGAVSFGKLAAMMPKSPGPLVGQAEAYVAAKDWNSAVESIRRAVAINPDDPAGHVLLVNAMTGAGRFDEARREALAIQKRWPKAPAGFLAEASVLTAQKNLADAERVLRASLRTVDAPPLVIQLVGVLLESGRQQDAETAVRDWSVRHPKDMTVRLAVAEASLASRQYPLASKMYRGLLEMRPDDPLVLNNLAWVLGEMGDPQALPVAERAAAKAPGNVSILETLGSLQLKAGEVDKAVQTLGRCVELAPASAVLRISYAKALVAAGRKNDARLQLEAVRDLPARPFDREQSRTLLQTL